MDYMVMEAVAIKVQQAEADEAEAQKRRDWMKDRDHLMELN